MSDKTEQQIRRYFEQPAALSSNFDFLVMQKISARRLAQARKQAQLQSTLISLGMLASLLVILPVLGQFFELPQVSLPVGSAWLIPALLVMVGAVLLDAALGLRRSSS